MTLDEELRAQVDRPGGDPELRCLALFHGAAVCGRFDAVDLLVPLSRARGCSLERLEEAALQVVAYGGFPRAIETLGRLARQRGARPSGSALDERGTGELEADGRVAWERVYGAQAEEVRGQLQALMPGFDRWVIQGAYGRVLSRGVLAIGVREILAVAALALTALATPLASHIRGALRNGFTEQAVEDTLLTCSALADARAQAVISQAVDRVHRRVYRP